MASSLFTRQFVNNDTKQVVTVIPADGPSFLLAVGK